MTEEERAVPAEEPGPVPEAPAEPAAEAPAQEAVPSVEDGREAALRARFEEDMRELRRIAPEIRSPADILRLDRRDAILDEVRNHNHTFSEAYRFVYADRLAEGRAREAARRAQNKAHLRPTGTAGTGDVTVPAAVERNIRAILPKAAAKDIRAYYQKDAKRFSE